MPAHKHWRILNLLVLLAIAELAISGCRSHGNGGSAEPGVMAQVNSYKVQRSELDKAYNTQVGGAPQKPTATEESALRLQILDQIIQTQLILQRAEKLGIKVSSDDVEARLTKAKTPYTREQFQKKLQDIGLSEDDYKTYLQHGLIVDKVIEKEITPKLTVSDAEVNAFYDQHKAQLPPSADENQVKQQIRDKLRSELEQVLKVAYTEDLRNGAEIHNNYAAEVLQGHSPK